MNFSINQRLISLGLAVALMGAAVLVLILNTERGAALSRAQLGELDFETFQIADRFKDKLRSANDHLRRYASSVDATAWKEFLDAGQDLSSWIGQQPQRLTTDAERHALEQLSAGYQLYLQRAEELHSRMERSHEAGASVAEYNSFFEQSRRLNDLGQALSRAHFNYRTQMLERAGRTLTELQFSAIGSLVLLFVFGLALAGVVYRDLLAPLRSQLVESQAVAERNEKLASLGLLAAGVAHEIRNPLTALKTALFLQQRKSGPLALDKADADLFEREILRLERIVNEFLEFARPARPRLEIIDVSQPLAQVAALLEPQLEGSRIRIVREIQGTLPIRVDPAQIQQVLINLVQNAADSISANGTIWLRARQGRKRFAQAETEAVIIDVEDTGKGIPPEVQKRLFDPFFTTKERGTGLGLSIAARMVEMNGGLLQFQTQINRGSTFSILFPLTAVAPPPAEAPKTSSPSATVLTAH